MPSTAAPIPDADDERSDGSTPPEDRETAASAAADASSAGDERAGPANDDADLSDAFVLRYEAETIDGERVDLAGYRGQVVLIVNTASKCGLTPQYAGLQSLYESRRDRGLTVLGFPANNFGNQEPGSNDEIAAFCEANFGVTFPMFAKVSVLGEDRHPLFRQLATLTAAPTWNFTKYLVDRDGNVVAHFGPRTAPDDPELLAKVDELLAEG